MKIYRLSPYLHWQFHNVIQNNRVRSINRYLKKLLNPLAQKTSIEFIPIVTPGDDAVVLLTQAVEDAWHMLFAQ